MTTGRKEEFNSWFESLIEELESEYAYVEKGVLLLSANSLKKWHWKKLWDIFGELENLETEEAKSIILEANGFNMDDLDFQKQMKHYHEKDPD